MKKINIAIDGPSGVGKSTIADIVAEKLNKLHEKKEFRNKHQP